MLSNNVTVCIFAWNEEKRLLRCIDNFKDTFRILVVDNFSTDATVSVATQAGYDCVQVGNPGYIETPAVMNAVMAAAKTDYILIASCSEFVPLALQKVYAEAANTGSHDVVRAFRESITAGQPIPISGTPTARTPGELRFFCKGSVTYEKNPVHGRGETVCAAERVLRVVENPDLIFYQFRDYDCSKTESAHCRYDDVLAKQRFESGHRFSWPKAIIGSLRSFAVSYFWHKSYRFGMLGFVHSYYRWQMEFTIWLRVWEWQNQLSHSDVVERNSKARRQMELAFQAAIAK